MYFNKKNIQHCKKPKYVGGFFDCRRCSNINSDRPARLLQNTRIQYIPAIYLSMLAFDAAISSWPLISFVATRDVVTQVEFVRRLVG